MKNLVTFLVVALSGYPLALFAQDGMPEPLLPPARIVKLRAGQGTIHINRATREELLRVPGIGESLAVRIIECRKENGRFLSWADLTEVKGIGPKKLARLKPYLSL
jgi:competence protein ComEA